MAETIIEYARKLSIGQLFQAEGFRNAWQTWKEVIKSDYLSDPPTQQEIYNLGDHLREIFKTTGQAGRSQSDVAGGGANWEALVCLYLNLCLIGRRSFVIATSF